MALKKCFKCGTYQPLSEFYAHPQMKDGVLGKCKSCTRIDTAAREHVLKRDPVWVDMERERNRKKQARYRALGLAQQTSPEYRKAWQKRNQHKRRAQCQAQRATTSGHLKNPGFCERCGTQTSRIHKHHQDYSKPLDVVWLCPRCHGLAHRKRDVLALIQ